MVSFDLISDIHLNFTKKITTFDCKYLFPVTTSKYLLVAGDIYAEIFDKTAKDDVPRKFFDEALKHYEKVIYVLGNHDYWVNEYNEGDFYNMVSKMRERYGSDRIILLDDSKVEVEGVKVIGSTLWTTIPPQYQREVCKCMNDYRYTFINEEDETRATIDTFLDKNKESFSYIKNYVETHKDDKIVVLTHHAPSFRSGNARPEYDKNLTYAYCNNYDNWIADNSNIKVWCHGHVHDPVDYMIEQTRIAANPCGYIWDSTRKYGWPMQREFDGTKLVDWNVLKIEV